MPPEDVLHRLIRQPVTQVGQGADDAVIAPARVLSRHPNQAISRSALRPSRFPISASVIRSGSERRNRAGNLVLRIRFSAARYSFHNKSSWLMEPVT